MSNEKPMSKPQTWSPNTLLTERQAESLLRTFVTTSFSINGPTGYEYQGRPLFSPPQLLEWLYQAATKKARSIKSVQAALTQQDSQRIENDDDQQDNDNDDDDDDYDDDDEDDDGDDD